MQHFEKKYGVACVYIIIRCKSRGDRVGVVLDPVVVRVGVAWWSQGDRVVYLKKKMR